VDSTLLFEFERGPGERMKLKPYHPAYWLVMLIAGYRRFISPLLGDRCRYRPTCSEYAQEALRIHGFFKGGGLALRRLGRCHPWHEGGYDPVPLGRNSEETSSPQGNPT
jgi:putative membrane protein insertion efficiency factor